MVNVWIFRHNIVSDKAKIRRRAVALQGFLTQSLAKFDEKTCMNPYVDRFLTVVTAAADFHRTSLSSVSTIHIIAHYILYVKFLFFEPLAISVF